jgi:hypothetical protein
MFSRPRVTMLCLAILAVASCAGRQQRDEALMREGWTKLGEGRVDGAKDRDFIPVAAGTGPFTTVMLKAENGRLDLFDVTVVFGDGSQFRPGTRLHFLEGKTSRPFDLPGGRRFIRQLEFVYGRGVSTDFRSSVLELWAR